MTSDTFDDARALRSALLSEAAQTKFADISKQYYLASAPDRAERHARMVRCGKQLLLLACVVLWCSLFLEEYPILPAWCWAIPAVAFLLAVGVAVGTAFVVRRVDRRLRERLQHARDTTFEVRRTLDLTSAFASMYQPPFPEA